MKATVRSSIIFGMMDGLVCSLGIVSLLVIAHARPLVIFAAAFGAGLAEFPGMAAGKWKSSPQDGKVAAFACGAASAFGAVVPATPYLVSSGITAYAVAVGIAGLLTGVVAYLAPEQGWSAVLETYGVLAAAVALCVAGGLIHF